MIHAAAIEYEGTVYTLPAPARHCNIIVLIVEKAGTYHSSNASQGFLDDSMGFLDREEAGERAIGCGQIKALNCPPELYSEDLW